MTCLLNGEQGEIRAALPKEKEKKEFRLSPKNGTMRRLYAYLLQQRHISRNVTGCDALCGTSEHAMLWMLEQNPGIQNVLLCLDADAAGIEANGRLAEILRDHGYNGIPALPAEEHPQLIVAPDVCQFITEKCGRLKPGSLGSLEGVPLDRDTRHPLRRLPQRHQS